MAELHKNLKSLRRERKIDLEAIEKRTKIDINYLKAIESGKFEILPSTYIRLFLKAYCVEIGADPVDALHQLDSMQNKNKKKPFISEKEVLPNEDANDTKNESSIIGSLVPASSTKPSPPDNSKDLLGVDIKVFEFISIFN